MPTGHSTWSGRGSGCHDSITESPGRSSQMKKPNPVETGRRPVNEESEHLLALSRGFEPEAGGTERHGPAVSGASRRDISRPLSALRGRSVGVVV